MVLGGGFGRRWFLVVDLGGGGSRWWIWVDNGMRRRKTIRVRDEWWVGFLLSLLNN